MLEGQCMKLWEDTAARKQPQKGPWDRRVSRDHVGLSPIDRGKKGVKRSLLVQGDGDPLALVASAANTQHPTRETAGSDP